MGYIHAKESLQKVKIIVLFVNLTACFRCNQTVCYC